MKAAWFIAIALLAGCIPAARGEQLGAVEGRVTSTAGDPLSGVTVEAASPVLPRSRRTTSQADGAYRLPLLPPGTYEVTFALAGSASSTRKVEVPLERTARLDVVLEIAEFREAVEVSESSAAVDPTSSSLEASVGAEAIAALPAGQSYRDLVKLLPGVQYTEDSVRGPSSGGSGQDNTYLFDGVNVTLPLFGTLSAEPSAHDIDQVTVVTGGAAASQFDRAGGFWMNSLSRSGSNRFRASLSFETEPEALVAARENSGAAFDESRSWWTASLSGPLVRDRLYVYSSYFAPSATRSNRSNLYGEVPDFSSDRQELFGKLTWAPSAQLLVQASLRNSDRRDMSASVSSPAAAASTSQGGEAGLEIATLEGSWVLGDRSFATFRAAEFANRTTGIPDLRFPFTPRIDGSMALDIARLDTQGFVVVPGSSGANLVQQQFIDRYGYATDAGREGGGRVGGGAQFDRDDFYRRTLEGGYDRLFGDRISHSVHLGLQWYREEEDLLRSSNGWGTVTIPGGTTSCPANSACAGQPIFFQASVLQQGLRVPGVGDVPAIHSEYESRNVEIEDRMQFREFTFRVGLLASEDRLFGQGLATDSSTLSGFRLARGQRSEMHRISFAEALQPRLGAVWAPRPSSTFFASYARYVPAVSSLPRAASWARDTAGFINVYFDRDGRYLGRSPEPSSSGKFFAGDLDPRTTDEYVVGTAWEIARRWTLRAHGRYRTSRNFWEDTENDSRLRYDPPAGVPRELYIRNLEALRRELGGSNFVIAELDGSFTKFWEAGLEGEWRGRRVVASGSYTWSHYYGNVDQDNTAGSSLANDGNLFVGSSNLADGGGRQLWDSKYGNLRGDRRHKLKVSAYATLPWRATVGLFALYQSGQPWEAHDYSVYPVSIRGTSTSDANRYAEPAGSRTTAPHHQVDLSYSQEIGFGSRFRAFARVEIFNLYDRQTGYDIQDNRHSAAFGEPLSFFDPRRVQLSLRFEFE